MSRYSLRVPRFTVVLLLAIGCDKDPVPPTAAPEVEPTTVASTTPEPTASVDTGVTAETEQPSATASEAPRPKTAVKPAPRPPPPEKQVVGKQVVESNYAAWLQSTGRYVVGKPGSVQAVLTAKGEYKCNENYPYKVKLAAAPEGVSYPDTTARGVSKGKERTTVTVPFTASSAGDKTISGTFFFSVCNESTCKIDKRPVSVTVTVHPQ